MSSVSTAFKVHYNQKLGGPSGNLGGTHHGLWGIDAVELVHYMDWVQYFRHLISSYRH